MSDNVYLITGGTGSFGKAFTRDLLRNHNPKQIRIFSRDELKQAQMDEQIKDRRVEYLCGDIRDYERLCVAMRGVDIVVHAAAMKRIEKCERDPQEAIKTNVLGSVNVANACLQSNVKAAILISTDKAVYPINTYGKTKALAENVWLQQNVYRGANFVSKYSVVRYGNVIGSRGSIIPLFKEQAKSGVITVTDAEMTRYFITLQQAVDLVHAAIELQQGAEIFLPKLKALRIGTLARLLAPEAQIINIGPRAGEKLHEILFTNEEAFRIHTEPNFTVINPQYTSWPYAPYTPNYDGGADSSLTAAQFTLEELQELISE